MRKIYRFIKNIVKPLKLHRFKFFGDLNKKITQKVVTNHAIVDGHKMVLDDKDSLRLSLNGVYEIEQTNLIKKLVKEGDYVLDIGANIGYYALILAKKVGVKGKVFCFEPDKTNFSILSQNVKNNNYSDRVVLFNDAVSDSNENIKLYISETNRGDHRIYSSDENRNYIEITALIPDEEPLLQNVKISFIKIDIQGSEMIALGGMKKLIIKNRPIVISEFWPKGIKMSGKSPDDYLNFYLKNNYSMQLLLKDGLKKVNLKELQEIVNIEKGNFENIVFTPI